MSKKGLVSIIIPVYNTDPILMQKCIDSVCGQTYKNIEIIIINDGSTCDDTVRLLDCLDDQRISLYDKENGGVSSARNYGLKKSKGEFVFFLDADDYLDKALIEELVKIINKGEYIAVISKIITVINGRNYSLFSMKNKNINIDDDFDLMIANTVYFASQGILFRSRIAREYEFDNHLKYGEDLLYSFKVLSNGTAYYTDQYSYYYTQNNESAIHDFSGLERYLKDYNYLYSVLCKKYSSKRNTVEFMMCDKIVLQLYRHFMHEETLSYRDFINLACKYRRYLISENIPKALKAANVFRRMMVLAYYRKMYLLLLFIIKLRTLRTKMRS